MAKSRKKPGCLCPIITIAMAHPVARSDHHSPLRTHKKNLADRVRLSHCIPTPFQSRQIGRGAHRRNPPVLSFHSTSFEVSCGPDHSAKRRPPASPARRCRHRATSYDEVQDSGDTRHPKTTHIYSMPTRSSVATHSPATAWRAFHRCRRSRWMALRCASGLISLNVALCSQVHGA